MLPISRDLIHSFWLDYQNAYGDDTPTERLAIYISLWQICTHQTQAFGGIHQRAWLQSKSILNWDTKFLKERIQSCFNKSFLNDLEFLKAIQRTLEKIPEDIPFEEFLARTRWKQFPLTSQKALSRILTSDYPVMILDSLPTPKQVLTLQSNGQRVISLLQTRSEFMNFTNHGRDVFRFAIHDLEHAERFFADPVIFASQVRFSELLLQVLESPDLQIMLTEPEFQNSFEYLASDMNAHLVHLLKTFKAIVLRYFKRKNGLSDKDRLDLDGESQLRDFLTRVAQLWGFNKSQVEVWLRVNTADFDWTIDPNTLLGTFVST